jgi:hypothetical protein
MTINETAMIAIRVVFNLIKGTALRSVTIRAGLRAQDTSKLSVRAKEAWDLIEEPLFPNGQAQRPPPA